MMYFLFPTKYHAIVLSCHQPDNHDATVKPLYSLQKFVSNTLALSAMMYMLESITIKVTNQKVYLGGFCTPFEYRSHFWS